MRILISLLFIGLLVSCADDEADKVEANFKSIQANLFDKSCATSGCHLGTTPTGGLSLEASESFEALKGDGSPGVRFVTAGEPDNSYLLNKLIGESAGINGVRMPVVLTGTGLMAGSPVSSDTINAIRQWITDGAVDNRVSAAE